MKYSLERIKLELQRVVEMAKAENYSEAFQLLDDLLQHNPEESKIWAKRAYVNDRQGDQTKAIADWSMAIGLCEEPHYVYMRGINFFQLGKFRDCISDFTRVIELCDMYKSDYYRGSAYFFRADAHLRLREFDKAKSDCMHIEDDMQTWTDRLRTKAEILAECAEK